MNNKVRIDDKGNRIFPLPADCPRCDRPISWVGTIIQPMKGYFFVECSYCQWSGPTTNSKENAAIRWNARAVEIRTEQLRRRT